MNRAQTSPEPGTLLDARVNTVFSASPVLWIMVVPGSVMADPMERERAH